MTAPSSSLPGQLVDVHLSNVRFVRHEAYEWEPIRYTIETKTHAEVSSDRSSVISSLDAAFRWHVGEGQELTEGPCDLELRIVATFEWDQPDLTDEDITGWVEFNSEHLLWPYLRSYVTTITSTAGLPPLTIYTISAPRPTLGLPDADHDDLEPVDTGSSFELGSGDQAPFG